MVHAAEVKPNDTREPVRHDWDRAEAEALYALPFADLMFRAQSIHRSHFRSEPCRDSEPAQHQDRRLPRGLRDCSQSAHYDTGLKATKLMAQADVVATARRARDAGASRFCMAAAWRNPKDRDLDEVCGMVSAVKDLGMETCATLGMLTPAQAVRLRDAGLDFYNHNVDTSPEFYDKIITTRTLQDRIDTLAHVRDGRHEGLLRRHCRHGRRGRDRLGMLVLLANLPSHPESVPESPVETRSRRAASKRHGERSDPIALARLVAAARI